MKDRFDLEEEINEISYFSTQLRNLSSANLEEELTKDEISNALEGIAVLLDIQANKIFLTMCSIFNLNYK